MCRIGLAIAVMNRSIDVFIVLSIVKSAMLEHELRLLIDRLLIVQLSIVRCAVLNWSLPL